MDLTVWIILLCATTRTLSQKKEICTNAPDCDPTNSSNINLEPPKGDTTYRPPGSISVNCMVSGDFHGKIFWIRNNSDGESTILNSTKIEAVFPDPNSPEEATLTESPPDNKFPYTYQCLAFGKCCNEHKSPPITVNIVAATSPPPTTDAKPELVISGKLSTDLFFGYYGFGKVDVSCNGHGGDNTTTVHWIRTDANGNNVTLNSTNLNLETPGLWKATLVYRPSVQNATYSYRCVVENKCCQTKISKELTIPYIPTTDCPEFFVFKRMTLQAVPSQRSINLSLMYDPDPEDTRFLLGVVGETQDKELDITVRKHVIHGLVPNTRYQVFYQIIYNISQEKECRTIRTTTDTTVTTLPDVPSRPRNVTVIVKENTLNVSWTQPEYINAELESLRYMILWRKAGSNTSYQHKNVSRSPYIIRDLPGYTSFFIKVRAVNAVGTGNSSGLISASTQKGPGPYIRILETRSGIEPRNFTGFGKINLTCTAEGNNATSFHWIRTDKDGDNTTLRSTPMAIEKIGNVFGNIQTLKASLLDRPDTNNFPFVYKCVVENDCCLTRTSSPKTIHLSRPPDDGCPSSGVVKPIVVNAVPGKRSVQFTWTYNVDPEDTGFILKVLNESQVANLTIAVRQHVFRRLVPNRKYKYTFSICYAGCKASSAIHEFTTMPDYPGTPRNVTVIVNGTTLRISWLPPKYLNGEFKNYILSWRKIDHKAYTTIFVTNTSFVLQNLDGLTTYSIKLHTVNNVGIGNNSIPLFVKTQQETITGPPTTGPPTTGPPTIGPPTTGPPTTGPPTTGKSSDDDSNSGAIAGGVFGAMAFLILIVVLLLFVRRKIQKKEREKSVREFGALHRIDNPINRDILASEQPISDPDDEAFPEKTIVPEDLSYIVLLEDWEIAPDNIKLLDKKLGGGQFGIVRQGLLTSGKGEPEVVAVKTLKDNAKESDLQDLMTELTILKEVNKIPHPNVIKLVGGCSIGGKLHVITEFCPGGNLRHLLINSRVYPSEESSTNYINLASKLNHRQLLKIAADVANGMIHLSSQKLVHRDLAARNILIGEDNMAKVSDFGLARDVGGAEEYIRNNQNLLPVKWMALESLINGRFTTASDVWSYGVLLHEITSLGDEPYKNISPYNIVSHVGSGCRIPKSPQCSNEIYEIMLKCWNVEPNERPTFKEIHESLLDMLMDSEKSYINISQIIDEGSLTAKPESKNVSIKDGSVRYTHA